MAGLKRADTLAQRYGVRPSALLAAHDPYMAYCVDEACALAAGEWQPRPEELPPAASDVLLVDGMPMLVGTVRNDG